jgi:putative ATP-dependent endonuclease of OLD family
LQVTRLTIQNFRGIESAELFFTGHTLLVGGNNVGKSTICEALDLVLGPDRLSRTPPVEEFDFRNARYLADDKKTPVPILIEVVLTSLTQGIQDECGATCLELWDKKAQMLLGQGDLRKADHPDVEWCLRLITKAWYDVEDDQFVAQTVFGRGMDGEGNPRAVKSKVKREIGFLYLRTIRTGSRALSLERGTLLDSILRIKEARNGMWETIRTRLATLDPQIDAEATRLRPILDEIEARLGEYIPAGADGQTTRLFVSQLTREHLRKTIFFFLTMNPGEHPIPFQQAGTGTLNTLMLALLSFLADIKSENVIFAMEEPEIALSPHTQRRITNYLIEETSQCFVTSHSPYVIERFKPDGIMKLSRSTAGTLTGKALSLPAGMKEKNYRQNFRRLIAEAMLGKGVIIGEGMTEEDALAATCLQLQESDKTLYPLDISGVSIINGEGDGNLEKLGSFFKEIGVPAYAFFDRKKRTDDDIAKLKGLYVIAREIPHTGAEKLLAAEVPVARQWEFLEAVRNEDINRRYGIPGARPAEDRIRELSISTLAGMKGEGGAARMLNLCDVAELPANIVTFLREVYALHPKPVRKTPAVPAGAAGGPIAG